jgi:hypothetical protein
VQEGAPPAPPLSTTYAGGNNFNNDVSMFDITAINDVNITGFDVNFDSIYSYNFEIYYKPGSFAEPEHYFPQDWILLGSAPEVQGFGNGTATPLPISFNLHVPAGETVGIAIAAGGLVQFEEIYINATPGTFIGNIYAEDNNIQIKEGIVLNGGATSVWNGTVHYDAPGCSSELTPVQALITNPPVSAFATPAIVCEGEGVTLIALNNGQQNFDYEWSPQIPGMQPSDGLNDTVTVNPMFVTTTFSVNVNDPNSPLCDTSIEVLVTVDNISSNVFIINLASQYHVDDPSVILIGAPSGGSFSGPGMDGDMFSPGSLAVGTYTITYTYTDSNGCTGTAEQSVEVLPSVGVGNTEVDKGILLFPNPSEGLFNMSIKLPAAVQSVIITIYDQIGKQVLLHDYGTVKDNISTAFDFSKRPKGVYYIKVNVDGDIFYRKMTIQ